MSTDLGQTQARFYSTDKTYTAWFCTGHSTKEAVILRNAKDSYKLCGEQVLVLARGTKGNYGFEVQLKTAVLKTLNFFSL